MTSEESQLIALRDSARQELMQIKSIETGKKYLNNLKTLEVWVRLEKQDAEMQNMIAEQKIRTQRILGQLISEGRQKGELATEGSFNGNRFVGGGDLNAPKRLSDLGLTPTESSTFQKIASIPDAEFENFIQSKKEAVNKAVSELTTAGILRVAKRFSGDPSTTSCLDRQIIGYPTQYYFELFMGEAAGACESMSNWLNVILRERYKAYTPQQIQSLKMAYRESLIDKAKAGELRIKV